MPRRVKRRLRWSLCGGKCGSFWPFCGAAESAYPPLCPFSAVGCLGANAANPSRWPPKLKVGGDPKFITLNKGGGRTPGT